MSLTNATPLEAAQAARLGSRRLAVLSTEERNAALTSIHKALADGKDEVLAANAKDLEAANKAASGGTLSQSLVKRLDLGKKGKYEDMLQGILDVRDLEDPSTYASSTSVLVLYMAIFSGLYMKAWVWVLVHNLRWTLFEVHQSFKNVQPILYSTTFSNSLSQVLRN